MDLVDLREYYNNFCHVCMAGTNKDVEIYYDKYIKDKHDYYNHSEMYIYLKKKYPVESGINIIPSNIVVDNKIENYDDTDNINLDAQVNILSRGFCSSLRHGRTDIAELLYLISTKTDMNEQKINFDIAFYQCCRYSQHDMAEWLLAWLSKENRVCYKNSIYDYKTINDKLIKNAFFDSVKKNNMTTMKWLLGKMNLSDIEKLFIDYCRCHELYLAKWVYENCDKKINVRTQNDIVIKSAYVKDEQRMKKLSSFLSCNNESLLYNYDNELAYWLCSLCDQYSVKNGYLKIN